MIIPRCHPFLEKDHTHESFIQSLSLIHISDSIAVAAAAKEVLGAENVVTATAITAFLTETEKNMAKAASKRLGLEHRMKRVFLMKSPDVLRNDENRCYYCKNIILTGIEMCIRDRLFDRLLILL